MHLTTVYALNSDLDHPRPSSSVVSYGADDLPSFKLNANQGSTSLVGPLLTVDVRQLAGELHPEPRFMP
jgi:hypothetical protein